MKSGQAVLANFKFSPFYFSESFELYEIITKIGARGFIFLQNSRIAELNTHKK